MKMYSFSKQNYNLSWCLLRILFTFWQFNDSSFQWKLEIDNIHYYWIEVTLRLGTVGKCAEYTNVKNIQTIFIPKIPTKQINTKTKLTIPASVHHLNFFFHFLIFQILRQMVLFCDRQMDKFKIVEGKKNKNLINGCDL